MSKVVVIGGGASGLIAALRASTNNEVTILEKNDKCGKKILLTGNGKCNYWNSDINKYHYNTDYFPNLEKIISIENQNQVLSFLADIGIFPKIKNGYFYPYSNQASSIREIFIKELDRRGVNIIYNFDVLKVIKQNNQFIIINGNKKLIADKVILANGSCAYPKTGSDGESYKIASSFNHTINKVLPSLVPLRTNATYFKELDGIRVDSKIGLYIDGKLVKEESGELQLTDYGVSGICIFNLSGLASINLSKGKKVILKINFVPFLDMPFYEFLSKRNELIKNRTLEELLESILNYKLMNTIFKILGIRKDKHFNELSENDKINLSKMLENFEVNISSTLSFDRAQVATGGVTLKEINPDTMESTIVKDLYLAGELLDVDGECGGFNLAFAFITGYIAGGVK